MKAYILILLSIDQDLIHIYQQRSNEPLRHYRLNLLPLSCLKVELEHTTGRNVFKESCQNVGILSSWLFQLQGFRVAAYCRLLKCR